MEKAIKNKVAKAVVPAVDVMFHALRSVLSPSLFSSLVLGFFSEIMKLACFLS